MSVVFEANWSRLVCILTGVVVLILVYGATTLLFIASESTTEATPRFLLYGNALFLYGILLYLFLFAPRGYRIDEGEVRIRRRIGEKKWSLAGLESVRILAQSEMKGTLNLIGSGGAFGFWGILHNPALGTFRSYCTNTAQCVLLQFSNGKKIVLSPDDPEAFLRALQQE